LAHSSATSGIARPAFEHLPPPLLEGRQFRGEGSRVGRELFAGRRLHRREGRSRVGVDRHRGVAQERLRTGRGDRHARRFAGRRIDDVVADVPEVPLDLLVEDLVVADGRLQEGVPVDQPLAAADEATLEEPEEGLADRRGTLLVEREAGAAPVAARPEFTQLAEDAGFVLLFPLPDPLHELLPTEIVAGELLLLEQPPLHDGLGGDSRMVGARHPEREVALHPSAPYEDVLEGVVESVAEVQRPGHVRRRDHDREDLPSPLRLGMPVATGVPKGVAAGLGGGMVEVLGELVHGMAGGAL